MFFIPGDTESDAERNNQQPVRASTPMDSSTIRILQLELRSLQSKPMEGFTISCDESNISAWTVGIFGPPGTPYQGGYFKAIISFPSNYPFSPPTFRFTTPVWHPNIYPSGDVCISTLHSPNNREAWSPTQNVRTVLLSIISLLNEPNPLSAANPTASMMYDKYKKQGDQAYVEKIRQQVKESKILAKAENVVVPETVDDYVVRSTPTAMSVVVDVDDVDDSIEPSEEESTEEEDDGAN